jgi:hypothetical protein
LSLKECSKNQPKRHSLDVWDIACKPKDKGGLGIFKSKVSKSGAASGALYLAKFYNQAVP